jgi:hypothetical protein
MISMGLIGEYIAHIYEEIKHRPLYVINDRLDRGFEGSSEERIFLPQKNTEKPWPRRPWLFCLKSFIGNLQHLKNACRTHAAGNAHGNNAPFGLAPLQFIQQLGSQLGARGSEGMSKGNGAAIGIDVTRRHPVFDANCLY